MWTQARGWGDIVARHDVGELENRYMGRDIFVIGSGASAGYIDPDFFLNKLAIGINRVYRHFPVSYTVVKHFEDLQPAIAAGQMVIASRHHCGELRYRLNDSETGAEYFTFEHHNNQLRDINYDVRKDGKVIVSYSTATSAMHIAALMGAATIILVGFDGGSLDGETNYPGYYDEAGKRNYADYVPQTIGVKHWLAKEYDCNVYSLNPFVNFGLEGHVYKS